MFKITEVVYLNPAFSYLTDTNANHILEDVLIQLFWVIEQPSEKLKCLAVINGQKSGHCVGPESLVEKPPVQSPSITVR